MLCFLNNYIKVLSIGRRYHRREWRRMRTKVSLRHYLTLSFEEHSKRYYTTWQEQHFLLNDLLVSTAATLADAEKEKVFLHNF